MDEQDRVTIELKCRASKIVGGFPDKEFSSKEEYDGWENLESIIALFTDFLSGIGYAEEAIEKELCVYCPKKGKKK